MSKDYVDISLNVTVLVRLTEEGMQVYKNYLNNLVESMAERGVRKGILHGAFKPQKPLRGGWYKFPLWELMQFFGQGMKLGSNLFVDNCIRVTWGKDWEVRFGHSKR